MTTRGRARPLGVTVLAILAAIIGVLSIVGGLAALGLGPFAEVATIDPTLGALVTLTGLIVLVLGIVYLFLAYGFWELRPWAWELGVALAVIGIALAIVDLVLGRTDLVSAVLSALLNLVILYYLDSPEVRAAFRRPPSGWRRAAR